MGLHARRSYSQCGEDLIIRYIFDVLKTPHPTYLDIGAHHPTYLNNTFIFYDQGSSGVNIEPDPDLFDEFRRQRERDTNLNIGVGDRDEEIPFFVMSVPTLNTFSEVEAKSAASQNKVKIRNVLPIRIRPVNAILEEFFPKTPPDFVSLDVEAFDLTILRSFDFKKWRPKVFCAETITYSEKNDGVKIEEIGSLMNAAGYIVYADTHINTIFIDREIQGGSSLGKSLP
ncbi:MAG TPA: FkbM family methyltransferase [Smithella sp.]|jgi:FkbM family methyltransferase|nr:FkbM family methyltransferase [Smithella sp.]